VHAAYSINAPVADQRTPEDDFFDGYADRVVDLEAHMLQATSFEFGTRHPQQLVVKMLQVEFGYDVSTDEKELFRVAWAVSMDLNYTFALVKQTTATLAVACVELTHRLLGRVGALRRVFPLDLDKQGEGKNPYARFRTTPAAVMETMMDLLELYTLTTHRGYTFLVQHSTRFTIECVMDVRIALNKLADEQRLPRYTEWHEMDESSRVSSDEAAYVRELKQAPPREQAVDGETMDDGNGNEKAKAVFVRRFILQPKEAKSEIQVLDEFFVKREEEYEVEQEMDGGWETVSDDGMDDTAPREERRGAEFGKMKRR
jgi:CTD kinase subunit beta